LGQFCVIPKSKVRLNITTNGSKDPVQASIIGLDGKIIQVQGVADMSKGGEIEFDVSNLPRGVYMVIVRNSHGQVVRKFVI